jgi:hypothetical protein
MKTLLGNRIYLNLPEIPETKLEVPVEFKKQQQMDLLQKFDRLSVFAVGEGIGEIGQLLKKIKVGDEVFVEPQSLKRGNFVLIDGKEKVAINFSDVIHIW